MLCSKCGTNNTFGSERCSNCNGLLWEGATTLSNLRNGRRAIDLIIYIAIWPLAAAFGFLGLYLFSEIIVPGPEALLFTCKFVALPLAIAVFYWERDRRSYCGPWTSAIKIFGNYLVLLFVSITAIGWINVVFVTDQRLVIEGTVTKLEANRKSGSWVYVRNSKYTDDYGLIVPPAEFSKLQLNAHFGICFRVGWLGIPFRWRHHDNGTCSFIHRSVEPAE